MADETLSAQDISDLRAIRAHMSALDPRAQKIDALISAALPQRDRGLSPWQAVGAEFQDVGKGLGGMIGPPKTPDEVIAALMGGGPGGPGLAAYRAGKGYVQGLTESEKQAGGYAAQIPGLLKTGQYQPALATMGRTAATAVGGLLPGANFAVPRINELMEQGKEGEALGRGFTDILLGILGEEVPTAIRKGMKPNPLQIEAERTGAGLGVHRGTGSAEKATLISNLRKVAPDLYANESSPLSGDHPTLDLEQRFQRRLEYFSGKDQEYMQKAGALKDTMSSSYPPWMRNITNAAGERFGAFLDRGGQYTMGDLRGWLKEFDRQAQGKFAGAANRLVSDQAKLASDAHAILKNSIDTQMGRAIGEDPKLIGDAREYTGAYNNLAKETGLAREHMQGSEATRKIGKERPPGGKIMGNIRRATGWTVEKSHGQLVGKQYGKLMRATPGAEPPSPRVPRKPYPRPADPLEKWMGEAQQRQGEVLAETFRTKANLPAPVTVPGRSSALHPSLTPEETAGLRQQVMEKQAATKAAVEAQRQKLAEQRLEAEQQAEAKRQGYQ